MRAKIRVPPKSVSALYVDDRVSAEHAFIVRHSNTVEILRFYDERDAQQKRELYLRSGYRDLTLETHNT